MRSSIACALLLAGVMACDNDPSRPHVTFPTGSLANASDTLALGRQAGIRFVFPGGLDPRAALDPANFVVTNLCTGLRVPGAIRQLGDTLVFTPSQALPYLTRIGVRIQNQEALNGAQQPEPITQTFVTVAPAVADVSWRTLNSPSNDLMTGIDFAENDSTLGYALSLGGGLYRTDNGGNTYAAVYKNIKLSFTTALHQFGRDTVYFAGGLEQPGQSPIFGVFRSVDAGVTVDTVSNLTDANLFSGRFVRIGGRVRGVVGGQGGFPRAFVYREPATVPAGTTPGRIVAATGITTDANYTLTDVAIARDTVTAIATAYNSVTGVGVAYVSHDGGASYSGITLPSSTPPLEGIGFITNTTALLLGDSAAVFRFDATTGAVQRLGAAQGIPQDSTNTVTGEVLQFIFQRAAFSLDGQRGYIVGYFVRRRPGQSDQLNGIILQSTNGGQSFTRQAIQGAADNGLGFPLVLDVKVKANGLAALSGGQGLLATRQSNAPTQIAVCSLTQP